MKYTITLNDGSKETIKSDTFDTESGLVVFSNIGAVPEGGKYPYRTSVGAIRIDSFLSIKVID